VKQESVNDEMKVKSSFMKIEEIDFIDECKQLLTAITRYD
jgi:hypothetical protein